MQSFFPHQSSWFPCNQFNDEPTVKVVCMYELFVTLPCQSLHERLQRITKVPFNDHELQVNDVPVNHDINNLSTSTELFQ